MEPLVTPSDADSADQGGPLHRAAKMSWCARGDSPFDMFRHTPDAAHTRSSITPSDHNQLFLLTVTPHIIPPYYVLRSLSGRDRASQLVTIQFRSHGTFSVSSCSRPSYSLTVTALNHPSASCAISSGNNKNDTYADFCPFEREDVPGSAKIPLWYDLVKISYSIAIRG